MALALHAKPTKVSATSAWIAPNGEFYAVNGYGHWSFALDNFNMETDELESRGWLHVSGTNIYAQVRPTHAQIDALWDLMAAYAKRGANYHSDDICDALEKFLAND